MARGKQKKYVLVWCLNTKKYHVIPLSSIPLKQRKINNIVHLNNNETRLIEISDDENGLQRKVIEMEKSDTITGEIRDTPNKENDQSSQNNTNEVHNNISKQQPTNEVKKNLTSLIQQSNKRKLDQILREEDTIFHKKVNLKGQKISSEVSTTQTATKNYDTQGSNLSQDLKKKKIPFTLNRNNENYDLSASMNPANKSQNKLQMTRQPTQTSNWNNEFVAPSNISGTYDLQDLSSSMNPANKNQNEFQMTRQPTQTSNWNNEFVAPSNISGTYDLQDLSASMNQAHKNKSGFEVIYHANQSTSGNKDLSALSNNFGTHSLQDSSIHETCQSPNNEEKDNDVDTEESSSSNNDDFDEDMAFVHELPAKMQKGQITMRDVALVRSIYEVFKEMFDQQQQVDTNTFKISEDYFKPTDDKIEIAPGCGFYLDQDTVARINATFDHEKNWKVVAREALLAIYGKHLKNFSSTGQRSIYPKINEQLYTGIFRWINSKFTNIEDKVDPKVYKRYITSLLNNKRSYARIKNKKTSQ